MALFRGIQEYIALDANNIPQGHPILYKSFLAIFFLHIDRKTLLKKYISQSFRLHELIKN